MRRELFSQVLYQAELPRHVLSLSMVHLLSGQEAAAQEHGPAGVDGLRRALRAMDREIDWRDLHWHVGPLPIHSVQGVIDHPPPLRSRGRAWARCSARQTLRHDMIVISQSYRIGGIFT